MGAKRYRNGRSNSKACRVIPSVARNRCGWVARRPAHTGPSLTLGMTIRHCMNSGGSPFIIFPNFRAPKPLEKLRIIFFICRYCFRSRLIS